MPRHPKLTRLFTAIAAQAPLNQEQRLQQALAERHDTVEDAVASKPCDVGEGMPSEGDQEHVLDALLIMGGTRGAHGISQWLRSLDQRRSNGSAFKPQDVTASLQLLARAGHVGQTPGSPQAVDLEAHKDRLDALLLRPPGTVHHWQRLLWVFAGANGSVDQAQPNAFHARSENDVVAVLRLLAFGGMPCKDFQDLYERLSLASMGPQCLRRAVLEPLLPQSVLAMDAALRELLLDNVLSSADPGSPSVHRVLDWLRARWTGAPGSVPASLREQMARGRLSAWDLETARAMLGDAESPLRVIHDAVNLLARADWQGAAAGYEQALKLLRQSTGRKHELLGMEHGRFYVISLLAQSKRSAWETARKFCIAQSGSRRPSSHDWWGLWAHAIGVRLGEHARDTFAFAWLPGYSRAQPDIQAITWSADRLMLAAWLGESAPGWSAENVHELQERLRAARQHWLAGWVSAAAERLQLCQEVPGDVHAAPRPAAWFGSPREAWRDTLASIVALDDTATDGQPLVAPELAWEVTLDDRGHVHGLCAFERIVAARGAVRLKPAGWAKLKNKPSLGARDSAVLGYVSGPRWSGSTAFEIDLVAAVRALVGHPAVMFADAPSQWVELVEAQPELEVLRQRDASGAEQFHFRVHPALVDDDEMDEDQDEYAWVPEDEHKSGTRLFVVRESAGRRARVIVVGRVQLRMAEMLSRGLTVPAHADAELAAALRVLSAHFELHSDAAAGQLVAGDNRLRAQLSPLGEGLRLQLVARPFGDFGPSVTPGQGRARLMCMHDGQSLATERDLAAEVAHRHAVLEALPFLDAEQAADAPWLLDDAELALRALEQLPKLPCIAALEWPRGAQLTVQAADSARLSVRIASGRDWLGLTGELQLDEGRVLGLQQLLALVQASRSRFVSLGGGQYLALSERLRQQLRDIDALAAEDGTQLRLPPASAGWLEETLASAQLQGDKHWRSRVDALAAAATSRPEVPAGLRAELRPYQQEGFVWMNRLAQAGLGACLADDMGLGKTIQTLALLLQRAQRGPALVLAPTSVCGNWVAEAQLFAPSLRCMAYGDAARRESCIAQAGAGDVVIASYALAHIDAEHFASRDWATLVLDEAQALKNAATKRARSVAELHADFRLALSGTPVENRLSDLWAIMHLINPGLLGNANRFAERFAGPIERQQDTAVRARLKRLIAPFLLRRTKDQVLQDLPARTEIIHRVQPGPEERALLEALRRDAQAAVAQAGADGKGAHMRVLAELMRLRRAACDPRLAAPEIGMPGAKIQEFERLVLELVAGEHKALVFSQFTDYLKLLAERLTALGLSYQYLDGSTPAAERTRRVAAFQRGEGALFLISLKAGGFGLNLTMADYVLIVDPWWNPAAEDQATGRAHRMGQQRPVTVYRLVTEGSIEERIIDLHRDKRSLAEGILADQDKAVVLDAQALAQLLLD